MKGMYVNVECDCWLEIGTGHREISCMLFFDNISENRMQKLDSLGKELRHGSTDTFIIFQMRHKTLSWSRGA